MSTTRKVRTISGTAEQIWEVLGKFDGISQWAPNVDHSCLLTVQSSQAGTVRRIQTGSLTVVEEVTEWEPNQRLAYTIGGLPPGVQFVGNTWTIEPIGDQAKVTLTTIIEPGPKPAHKLVAKAISRKLAGASDQMLDGLSAAVAQRRTQS